MRRVISTTSKTGLRDRVVTYRKLTSGKKLGFCCAYSCQAFDQPRCTCLEFHFNRRIGASTLPQSPDNFKISARHHCHFDFCGGALAGNLEQKAFAQKSLEKTRSEPAV